MVYDPKEFHLLHELTEHGEEVWRWMLEKEADRILFKNWCLKHPMKALWWLVKKAFGGKDVDQISAHGLKASDAPNAKEARQ